MLACVSGRAMLMYDDDYWHTDAPAENKTHPIIHSHAANNDPPHPTPVEKAITQ
jgi:hypothetical protein